MTTKLEQAARHLFDAWNHGSPLDMEMAALEEALAEPELNLNCKSVQKRLATSWGYVKAEQAEQDPVKMMNSVGNTEAYMPDQQTAGFNIQLYAAPVSIEAAVLAEREACAKVCEKIVPWGNSADDWAASCLNKAAKFIRARG